MTCGRGGVVLWFGLALWTLAPVARAEHKHRRHHDEAESSDSGDGDSHESARERRKRRHEERDRLKAEKAAEAGATESEGAPPAATDAASDNGKKKSKNAPAPTAAAPVDPEPPKPEVVAEPVLPQLEVGTLLASDKLEPSALPEVASINFTSAPPEQLKALDGRLTQLHEDLQSSERCEAIRGASRVPFRTWMLREHQRELFVCVGLFVFSLIVGFGFESRLLKSLLPIAPFAACVYLAWATSNETTHLMDAITSGLRACSTPLDEGKAGESKVVHRHFEQVARMGLMIDSAYQREDGLVPRVMREYKM